MHKPRIVMWLVVIVAAASGVSCKTSVYRNWGDAVVNVGSAPRTVDDISFMLGSPPKRCDDVEPFTFVGLFIFVDQPVIVAHVWPNSAASEAGLRVGDDIRRIGTTDVSTSAEALAAIKSIAKFDEQFEILTKRGKHTVLPRRPKTAKQCYWEIHAGSVGDFGGAAYVDPTVGTAASHGSVRQRFFRAACQVYDGLAVRCSANWQE